MISRRRMMPSNDAGRLSRLGGMKVKMLGPAEGEGKVVWLAPGQIDLALVRSSVLASSQAQAATWSKGRPMKVGASVFAIGNPHNLGWSHTQGVISQLRTQDIDSRQVRVIQTQAAINPGNSGGGLYDQEGYLLGINSWTADKSVSEGLGFAIALDSLLELAPPQLEGQRCKCHDLRGTHATMSTVRLRRLQADYDKVREYVNRHPRLQLIQSDGTPPERYQLEYRIRGLRQTADELSVVKSHMVEIALPVSYPRMPPQCRMLTPIFHPNIAPHAICIGDHWSPGEPLWSIIARIGEMISYQSYNTKSPLERRGGPVG